MSRITALADTIERRRTTEHATPGQLAQALDAHTVQTPALEVIDRALVDVADHLTEGRRLIISMPPQEGKSQRTSRRFPTWLLHRNRDLRIAIASYEHRTARRWGRDIRNDIKAHPELGLTVERSSSAADEWTIEGHTGGVYSVGIGGALTGRPVDLLIIDDPIKDRKQADSIVWREFVWDWWTDVAVGRLAPGAPVVLILTRWHEDDLAGRLLAAEDSDRWQVINIPALADHNPDLGQTDPLGRQPGEWLRSARGRTTDQWEQIRVSVGARTFTALYQGRPSPEAGDVFLRNWWRRYPTPLWAQQPDGSYRVDGGGELVQSWDMAFKDTRSSDFVVGQVWLHRDASAYLVDQVRARLSFTDTLAAVQRMCGRWPQANLKLVEDKANGTAVIDSLRNKIPGIVPVTPTESKYARAQAVAPFVEAGNVLIPEPPVALFEVDGFVEEHAGFPNAAHDDQVDATSQALARLMMHIRPRGARMTYVSRR